MTLTGISRITAPIFFAFISASKSNAKPSTSQVLNIFLAVSRLKHLKPHCESLSLNPAASARHFIYVFDAIFRSSV